MIPDRDTPYIKVVACSKRSKTLWLKFLLFSIVSKLKYSIQDSYVCHLVIFRQSLTCHSILNGASYEVNSHLTEVAQGKNF